MLAAHAAVFAAEPPPWTLICAGGVAPVRQRLGDARHHVDHEVAEDDELHAVAQAIWAASVALRSTRRTLASRLAPSVSRWK